MRLQSGLGMQLFEGLTGAGRSFQNGSLTWQLGGGVSPLMAVGRRAQFLAMWAPHGAASVSLSYGSCLPPE